MKDDCLFCKIVKGKVDSKKIYEDELVIAIFDAFPNVSGHTLIIPKNHYDDYTKIPNDLLIHINEVAQKIAPSLMEKFNKTAITLLVNYGESQAIKHYHLHLLPNFNRKEKRILTNIEAYNIYMGK